MYLLLAGLSHEVAGIEVREQAAVGPDLRRAALTLISGRAGVEGGLCGRRGADR